MEAAVALLKNFSSGKAGALATTLFAGSTTFAAAEITTGNTLLALAFAIASAGLANWPRIIKAKSDSTSNERIITANETSNIIKRLHDEVEFLAKTNAVLRISKHNLLNECQRLGFHIQDLCEILKENNIDAPEFRKATFQELMGEEDRKMSELTEIKENGKH